MSQKANIGYSNNLFNITELSFYKKERKKEKRKKEIQLSKEYVTEKKNKLEEQAKKLMLFYECVKIDR